MSRRSARPADSACVRHLLVFSAAETVIGPGCELGGLSLRAPLPGDRDLAEAGRSLTLRATRPASDPLLRIQ